METATIRRRLHEFIDKIEDKRAAAIYTLFEDEIDMEAKALRNYTADEDAFEFWKVSEEDVYEDYRKGA